MTNEVAVKIYLQGGGKFKSDVTSAMNSLEKGSNGATKNMSVLGSVGNLALKGIATAAVATATAVGTAFVAISKNGLKVAADLESEKQGFVTLLGSVKKADDAIQMIIKDANTTPFDPLPLIKANQALTLVTKNAVRSEDILLNVGKALAAAGKGGEELDRVIFNLQQIANVGKITELDIRQFGFAGINILELLADYYGTTEEKAVEMVKSSKDAFADLEGAFAKAGTGGGKFADAFKNQAGTLNQLISNLRGNWDVFTARFVQDTGIFAGAKKIVEEFGNILLGIGDSVPFLVKQLQSSSVFEYLKSQFQLAKAFIDGFVQSFLFVWNTMRPAVEDFMNTLNQTFGLGTDNSDKFKTSMLALGKAAGVILSALAISFLSVLSAVLKINNAIASMIGKFQDFRNRITGIFSSISSSIGNAFRSPINNAIDWANNLIGGYNKLPLSDIPFIQKFANGGVVGGNSTTGDKVMARVNSGEMILTRGQQATLLNMLKNNGSRPNVNINGNIGFSGSVSPIQQQMSLVNMLKVLK